jgi:23S rRNA (guanosine2251-2'-O)-methyltransferase
MKEWITGRNPVYETVRAGRREIFRIRVAEGVQEKGRLAEVLQMGQKRRLPVERVPRRQLDGMGESHQGVALEAGEYPYTGIWWLARGRACAPWCEIIPLLLPDSLR